MCVPTPHHHQVSKPGWAAGLQRRAELQHRSDGLSSARQPPGAQPDDGSSPPLGSGAQAAARAVLAASTEATAAASAAEKAAKGVESTQRPGKYVVPPVAMQSPRQLAILRQDQRNSAQRLCDLMEVLDEETRAQRVALQQRLHALCAKLQYGGEAAAIREEIVAEMRALAAEDSAILPVPPSLELSPPLVLTVNTDADGLRAARTCLDPHARPSTANAASAANAASTANAANAASAAPSAQRPSPRHRKPTQASSGSEARSPTRGRPDGKARSPPRPRTAEEGEWLWQRQSSPDRRVVGMEPHEM